EAKCHVRFTPRKKTKSGRWFRSAWCHFRTLRMMLWKDAPWLQVDTRFSRAAGGAFPSCFPRFESIRHHRRDMEFMFHAAHAPMKPVYAYQSRDLRFGWIALQPTRCRLKYQAGVEPMAGLESKLRQDITPTPDAEPLLGSVASEVVRYLAAFAM